MSTQTIAGKPVAVSGGKSLALAVIAAAQLTVVLDVSIVNVALPSIQRDLGFSPTALEWVVNAYALAFGGLLLLGGRLADVYGRRRMLVAGLVLLVAASLAGGLAPGSGWLIAARVAQGVAGALVAPAALALIAATFAEGAERNRAMAVYAAMSGAGGALGNVLGGVLTTGLSWRWVLFVNVPIGVVAAALAPRAFGRSSAATGRIDIAGAVMATAGIGLVVYGLMHAASDSWGAPGTVVPLLVGGVTLLVFVLLEARGRMPLMPLGIWADRNRAGAYAAMLVIGAATVTVFYFLTLFMQIVLEYSALRTGFGFLVFAVGAGASSAAAGPMVSRFGPRPALSAGALALTAGLWWLSLLDADATFVRDLAGPLALAGIGVGLCFVPLTLAAVVRTDHDTAGIASAVLNTCQQVGGSLGLAVFGTIAATVTRHRVGGPAAQDFPADPHIFGDALAHGYGVAYLIAAATVVVACAVAVVAIREVSDNSTAAIA
ncbi:MFS transporter [Nocardia nepalensis]|uniref:MFS transporter n=1 Tax=Nocardia nepalensis TaxID=3375448 RepID=UPI003B678620